MLDADFFGDEDNYNSGADNSEEELGPLKEKRGGGKPPKPKPKGRKPVKAGGKGLPKPSVGKKRKAL